MYYAKHKLYKKISSIVRDSDGFFVETSNEEWEYLGPCRCDDDNTTEVADERGNVLRASYHIVADKCNVDRGDIVKVEGKGCIGQVKVKKETNFYNYVELWI
jgi:hypothetical protein|nr:MAG TPA: hypothetical protein [Caudoviricetes sp.]